MINANHLMVFNSVANNLSFTRAAEELYTSQPSVSMQIRKTELRLGPFIVLGYLKFCIRTHEVPCNILDTYFLHIFRN